MSALPFHTPFVLALGMLVALSGCTLPSRLGLANIEIDPLEKLTQEDPAPGPYPTALNNLQRPQVLRPIVPTMAPVAQVTPANQPPAPPPLPLQQASQPNAMPLNPQALAGRLPVVIPDVKKDEVPSAKAEQQPATRWEPPPVVLIPASSDVSSLFAAKEVSWPALPVKELTPRAALPSPEATIAKESPSATLNAATIPPPTVTKFAEQKPSEPKPDESKPVEPAESFESLLPKLITAVEQEIRARTARKEEDELPALEQKLRLLQLVADRSDDAVEKIDKLPPAEREAFKQLMFALSTWLSPDEAKRASLRNAKVLRSLQEVDNQLAIVSKLDLKNLLFCEKVESFGWYTEFPRAEFTPKQQVILYVEVQNFAAESKTTTSFETELQGSYQIFDAAGNIVDERQLPLDREVCRNFRRDYFLAYRIYLPGELPPGRYRLELTIEDLKAKKDFKGRKQGEAMIEFAIK